jgi:hypothetical protein
VAHNRSTKHTDTVSAPQVTACRYPFGQIQRTDEGAVRVNELPAQR